VSRAQRDWSRVLLRPQVLVAFVLAVLAAPYLFGATTGDGTPSPLPQLQAAGDGETAATLEVPLVVVDADGLTRPAFATVESAEHPTAVARATLEALRAGLVEEGVWPGEVPAPAALAFEANRRRVVVVDVQVPGPVAVSVAQETAALRSVIETLLAGGADDVRVLVNGAPAATLWGHVALP
jgi:hypothetical protein